MIARALRQLTMAARAALAQQVAMSALAQQRLARHARTLEAKRHTTAVAAATVLSPLRGGWRLLLAAAAESRRAAAADGSCCVDAAAGLSVLHVLMLLKFKFWNSGISDLQFRIGIY